MWWQNTVENYVEKLLLFWRIKHYSCSLLSTACISIQKAIPLTFSSLNIFSLLINFNRKKIIFRTEFNKKCFCKIYLKLRRYQKSWFQSCHFLREASFMWSLEPIWSDSDMIWSAADAVRASVNKMQNTD